MRVLVIFGSPFLYGMERAVIELFDAVRPVIEPEFLLSTRATEMRAPVNEEVKGRRFRVAYYHDLHGYPRLQKTRSLRHLKRMVRGLAGANLDALRASRDNDIIYISNGLALIGTAAACAWYRLQGRRVVYAFHDTAVMHRFFPHLLIAFATDIVHHTDTNARELRTRYPVLRRRPKVVIPLVVDINRGTTIGNARSVASDTQGIVFIGQVSRHKGIDLLVDAFIQLAPHFPDIVLRVVGGASDSDFEARLRDQVEAHGLQARVSFLGYRNDVFDVLRGSYIFVQPSRPSLFQEAFGRGVVEAMSVAIPAVVFRSGALPELVSHGETGLICDEESSQSLSNALRVLLTNGDLHERCSRGALERYNALYCADRTVPRWRAFFLHGSRASDNVAHTDESEIRVAPKN